MESLKIPLGIPKINHPQCKLLEKENIMVTKKEKVLMEAGLVAAMVSVLGMLFIGLAPKPAPWIVYFFVGAVVGLIFIFAGTKPWRSDSRM